MASLLPGGLPEPALQAVLDGLPDGVILHGNGRVTHANEAALRLLGLGRERLIGAAIAGLLAPGCDPKGEGPVLVAPRPAGGKAPVRLMADHRPLRGEGTPVWMLLLREADTLQGELDRLRGAKEQAEQESRSRADMLRMASHEIRTALNGMLGMIELMLFGDLPDHQRAQGQIAQESGEALLGILNNILDLSKIEAGKLTLQPSSFALPDLVEHAVELLAPRADAKGIALLSAAVTPLPAMVRGDAGRLRQVLLNLMDNAIKHTDGGGVSVTMGVASRRAGGGIEFRVEVADTGIGLPADAQAKLFQEFSQIAADGGPRQGGTGLGLSISKRLVALMGGTIGFDSAPSRGSRFWFSVPLEVLSEEVRPDTGAPLEGRRILLVDDNRVSRPVLTRQLRGWGASVTAVRSSQALSAAWGTRGLELVLIDHATAAANADHLAALAQGLRGLGARRLVLLAPRGVAAALDRYVDAVLHRPARQALLLAALRQPPASVAAPAAKGRLLLVEDSSTSEAVACEILAMEGYEIEVARTGTDALEAIGRGGHDLVLLDVTLPDMNGPEVARAIRALDGAKGSLSVIAVTGHAMPADRDRCLASGMNDYVVKPLRRDLLLEAVARWMPMVPPGDDQLDGFALTALANDLGAEAVARLVRKFMDEAGQRVGAMAAASEPPVLEREAHTLKSIARTFGAWRLAAAARQMEQACRDQAPAEEVRRLCGILETTAAATAAAYRTHGLLGPGGPSAEGDAV